MRGGYSLALVATGAMSGAGVGEQRPCLRDGLGGASVVQAVLGVDLRRLRWLLRQFHASTFLGSCVLVFRRSGFGVCGDTRSEC